MTKGMREAIDQAKRTATRMQPARVSPQIHESVFWALKCAGYINDSGWLTDQGLSAE